MTNSILVTGGAGFIGSNFILYWLSENLGPVINLDKLTYAGNMQNLTSVQDKPDYTFVQGDICEARLVSDLLTRHQPRAIVHFAAETHVDRSILESEPFVRTNIEGTFVLLESTRAYLDSQEQDARKGFRFLHVSTDEVYGSLTPDEPAFTETTPYAPNSPYAASKAASDFLVRAWAHTYGIPAIVTHCSNNYGPYQFPEKLIPLVITHALAGMPLPIYGDGLQVRDWLFVGDHCKAIATLLARGTNGESYNIGAGNQRSNLEIVEMLCALLDELVPESKHKPHARLITTVTDRPGHDRRYAIDASKIESDLGWKPEESFATGLRKTVQWYLANKEWVEGVTSGRHKQWPSTRGSGRVEDTQEAR